MAVEWTETPAGHVHPVSEVIAREFHRAYEELAPRYSYETRADSAVPWEQVPLANRRLMIDTVRRLVMSGWITFGQRAVEEAEDGR